MQPIHQAIHPSLGKNLAERNTVLAVPPSPHCSQTEKILSQLESAGFGHSRTWISASKLRNHALDNTLIDWLNLYGLEKGFAKDQIPKSLDFAQFIMDKGISFEAGVLELFRKQGLQILKIVEDPHEISVENIVATMKAMSKGQELIYQALLAHAPTQTFGVVDLLLREDVASRLFPESFPKQAVYHSGSDTPDNGYIYIPVDIKYSTLHFTAKTDKLVKTGSTSAYEAQCALYARALGWMQGVDCNKAYLLGRGWTRTSSEDGKRITQRTDSCMDRLAHVPLSKELLEKVDNGTAWMRKLHTNGQDWQILPTPSREELRPNMKSRYNGSWTNTKFNISKQLGEITSLWQVGLKKRQIAHDAGIYRWDDPRINPERLGMNPGTITAAVLERMLEVNHPDYSGHPIPISEFHHGLEVIENKEPCEFFVDFETVSNLDDDFTKLPKAGGQSLIAQIGCVHKECGKTVYRCFTVDQLSEENEAAIIDQWLAYMQNIRKRLPNTIGTPKVFHWSPAEDVFMETAYNSAVRRHPDKDWPIINWYDLLKNIVKAEPMVVQGAMGFGLKAIAKAMAKHKLIKTTWEDGPTDGLGAMVGLWTCDHMAREFGCSMKDLPITKEIEKYNRVDTVVMQEILAWMRSTHRSSTKVV